MTRLLATTVAAAALFPLALASATSVSAQTLDTFGVLAALGITNDGPSSIDGNIGLSPGLFTDISGFPPGLLTGTIYTGSDDSNNVAEFAKAELIETFNNYFGMAGDPATIDLTGSDLGVIGELTPGVYSFDTSAQLTGTLTLDAQGDPNAVFVIITGSTLITAVGSSVVLANGAQGSNVYWVVGSSATINASTTFVGQILALTMIELGTEATITCGAAWAQNAIVTLLSNTIIAPGSDFCAFTVFSEVVGDDATPNQEEAAGVIDDYVDDGGDLPESFQELLDLLDDLTPEEVAAAFSQLSGEAATGVAPAGTQAMNSFLSLVLNSGSGPDGERSGPKVATVRVLGYADTDSRSPGSSAIASFDHASGAGPAVPRRWDMWAAAFGGENNTDGDSSAGSHDRSARVFGVAGGFDFHVTPNTRVGIAFGGGGTDFGLSDGLGGGSSAMFQTAIHGRTDFDAAYIEAALAYGYHDVSTDRTVTVIGMDRFTAAFSAHNVAGHIEGGYRFGWLTPYGALRLQAFHTPAYAESTESGSPDFALAYDSNTALMARTELGARIERILALDNGARLALRSRIAWAHDFWSGRNSEATFQALPGSSSFTVSGAKPATDSLLLSAGAEIGLRNGFSIAGWFDGEFADGSETYAGNARVSYAW